MKTSEKLVFLIVLIVFSHLTMEIIFTAYENRFTIEKIGLSNNPESNIVSESSHNDEDVVLIQPFILGPLLYIEEKTGLEGLDFQDSFIIEFLRPPNTLN